VIGDCDMHDTSPLVARITSTNSKRYVAVGTTKKSVAITWPTWFARTSATFATVAVGDGPCTWRRWTHSRRSRASAARHVCEAHPHSGFACDIVRINAQISAGTVGPPVRRRLFQVQNRRNPRRCQPQRCPVARARAFGCHPAQIRDNHTQRTRVSAPATSSATPPATARIPSTGGMPSVFWRSAVAFTGPMSMTVSRLV